MCDPDLKCRKCKAKNTKVVHKAEAYLKNKCVIEPYLVDSKDLIYFKKNILRNLN